jgi:murein DD-endopeptidase MepM/ murein hydrolase activator NlpD
LSTISKSLADQDFLDQETNFCHENREVFSLNSLRLKLLLGFILAAVLPACSSVPRVEVKEKGLFQSVGSSKTVTSESLSFQKSSIPIPLSPDAAEREASEFIWPVKEGKVTSFFGNRTRDYHEGIDIRTNSGRPIFAAKEGEVIYSSRKIRGYGNMIVIKHKDELATVYAHNRKNLVKRGDRVSKGQLIGLVGATGKATGPHLHFEIRKSELPQDPLLYLPQVRSPVVATK